MYSATQTFWLDPTNMEARGLRRYSNRALGNSPDCAGGYHQALVYTEQGPAELNERGYRSSPPEADHSDPRWPTTCSQCDYRFTETDVWQSWSELIYERADGQQFVLHPTAGADVLDAPSAPPGAMWDAKWIPWAKRDDGICLMVRLPNGHDWMVDSEANNCTRKGEPHACWVRHGNPRTEPVTVDKAGDTCTAGAGSIAAGDYHGFLQNGLLTAG